MGGAHVKRNGKKIASVRLVPKKPGEIGPVQRLTTRATFTGHVQRQVCSPAISPDGLHAATYACGSRGEPDLVRLWRLDNGQEVRTFGAGDERVGTIAFTADGRLLLSGEKALRIWDYTHAGPPLKTLKGPRPQGEGFGPFAGFSQDARWAVTSDETDHSLRVWDVAAGKVMTTMSGHKNVVCAIDVSLDGKRAASGGNEGIVRLWDTESGKELKRFDTPFPIYAVRFSPDGQRLAWQSGANEIALCDLTEEGSIRRCSCPRADQNHIRALSFTPDGNGLLACGNGSTWLMMWDTRSCRPVDSIITSPTLHIAVAPDGRHAVTTHDDGIARVWQLPTLPAVPEGR